MTFTFKNATYTQTESGYCYKEDAGHKVRISKETFENARLQYEAEKAPKKEAVIKDVRTVLPEDGDKKAMLNIAYVNGKLAVKKVEDGNDKYTPIEVEMKTNDKRMGKFAPSFEFEGKRYWTDKARAKGESAPKAKRVRKSKDIGFEGEGITLTSKQADFIKRIPDTGFFENGLESVVWVDCLITEIGGQFKKNPYLVGAMVSTLREKGLVNLGIDESKVGKPKMMSFTPLGKKVAKALGLK